MNPKAPKATFDPMALVLPLVLAQFICSYAGSNMNVAISAIARDLNTSVHGVQTAITLFTLTMAALMIPGSILTDIWGRKLCFRLGLLVYGIGGLIAAFAPNLGILTLGYSFGEGIGSSLLIPPVYILTTVNFPNLTTRAKYFGMITMAAGLGAAAGPLIGGLITSWISWRASFIAQVLVVLGIIVLSRRIVDPGIEGAKPRFDLEGAVLSALGLVFMVGGILLTGSYGWVTATKDFSIAGTVIIPQGGISPFWIAEAIGAVVLFWFFRHIGHSEKAGKQPLLSPRLFRNRTSNLGLVTQNIQWLILQGSFFVISVYVQTVRGENAVKTGLILTPATIGILAAGALAQRMASRRSQSMLIRGGFVLFIVGILLLLVMVSPTSNVLTFVPGLLLCGLGIGVMLTASVNVVQSAWPEKDQGEISGLSRSVSNLGSALGTSLLGSVLVSEYFANSENSNYAAALLVACAIAAVGLIAALFIPTIKPAQSGAPEGKRQDATPKTRLAAS